MWRKNESEREREKKEGIEIKSRRPKPPDKFRNSDRNSCHSARDVISIFSFLIISKRLWSELHCMSSTSVILFMYCWGFMKSGFMCSECMVRATHVAKGTPLFLFYFNNLLCFFCALHKDEIFFSVFHTDKLGLWCSHFLYRKKNMRSFIRANTIFDLDISNYPNKKKKVYRKISQNIISY